MMDKDDHNVVGDQLELLSVFSYLNSTQMALILQVTWNLSQEVWHSWVDVLGDLVSQQLAVSILSDDYLHRIQR